MLSFGVAPFELLAFAVTLCRHRNRDLYHGLLRVAADICPELWVVLRNSALEPALPRRPTYRSARCAGSSDHKALEALCHLASYVAAFGFDSDAATRCMVSRILASCALPFLDLRDHLPGPATVSHCMIHNVLYVL